MSEAELTELEQLAGRMHATLADPTTRRRFGTLLLLAVSTLRAVRSIPPVGGDSEIPTKRDP